MVMIRKLSTLVVGFRSDLRLGMRITGAYGPPKRPKVATTNLANSNSRTQSQVIASKVMLMDFLSFIRLHTQFDESTLSTVSRRDA